MSIKISVSLLHRKQLNDAVLGAYEQALTQSQNSMAKHHEMQQAPEGQAMDMTGM